MTVLALGVLLCAVGASAQVTLQVPPHWQYPVEGLDFDAAYATTQDGANSEGGAPVEIMTGTAPFTCAITSGSLPSGMSLKEVTPTGGYPAGLCVIYGTPTVEGDFTVTFKVTDATSATASQSVTFPVYSSGTDRTNCTPTSLSASGVTATGANVTWTTSAACSSQIWYGQALLYKTVVQDTSGVTSHLVSLTGLESSDSGACPSPSGCGAYVAVAISCGIVGGAPADYLCEFANEPNAASGVHLFTTSAGASSGTATFTIDLRGPHNVVQGYPMYVQLYNSCTGGCSDYSGSQGLKWQVTGLPANTQVHWPYPQDWGVTRSCTVSTGSTTNDTCTMPTAGTYGEEQFEILTNVGGTTPTGSYTLTLTATAGAAPTVVTQTWTMNVQAVPAIPHGHPGTQPAVPGFSTWQSNMTTYGRDWYIGPDDTCGFGGESAGFYDGWKVANFISLYTGNPSTWNTAISNCESNYVHYETVTASNWQGQAIYVFSSGPFYQSVTTDDANGTSGVAGLSKCCGGYLAPQQFLQPYADADYARESSWMLEAKRLDYDLRGSTATAPGQPTLSCVSGGSLAATWYTVQATYWNPTVAPNHESAPSSVAGGGGEGYHISCSANTLLQVTSPSAGEGATGWNVYVTSGEGVTYTWLQNSTPIAIGTSWTEPTSGLVTSTKSVPTTLAEVQALAAQVLGNIDQDTNDDPNTSQESFMAGLLMQAAIEYQMDPNTGNDSDPRVYAAVKALWDHMMAEWWVPWAGTNGGYVYELKICQAVGSLCFGRPESGNLTLEDLNPLVAQAAAWINAENGGGTAYQLQGDTAEYDGIVEPAVGLGVGFLGKTFTQDYRNSFSYMRWRGETTMCTLLGGVPYPGSGSALNCTLDPIQALQVLPPLNLGLAVQ
jgi:hypothetical protein